MHLFDTVKPISDTLKNLTETFDILVFFHSHGKNLSQTGVFVQLFGISRTFFS